MRIFAKLFSKREFLEPIADRPRCSGKFPQVGDNVFFHVMKTSEIDFMTVGRIQNVNGNSYTVNDDVLSFEDIFHHEVLSFKKVTFEEICS